MISYKKVVVNMCQNIENQTNKIEDHLEFNVLGFVRFNGIFSHYCKAVNNPYIL